MVEECLSLFDDFFLETELSHLKGSCYLDQTGAALYTRSQVEAIAKDLANNLYSNPHSNSLPSKLCADTVDQVRYRILEHFNTTSADYSVVFTSGATQSLKYVAESFDFAGKTCSSSECQDDLTNWAPEFVYLQDNHTSVLGMRNVDNIVQNKVKVKCLPHSEAFKVFNRSSSNKANESVTDFKQTSNLNHKTPVKQSNALFVYPGQCNFSGVKYPLSWIEQVQNGALDPEHRHNWFCLLDAANLVSSNPLNLSSVQPDFVTISFYKMWGLPTGLGALIVRNESAAVIVKKYFGGGTVQVALTSTPVQVFRPSLQERFEDGTINFLSIVALRHGLDWHEKLHPRMSMDAVSVHCFRLARYTYTRLGELHHSNGRPAVRLYVDTHYLDVTTQGGIVNFNMLRNTGEFVGYMEVLNLANLHNLHLRTGCFCNPGACQRHLGISEEQYYKNFEAGHVCGDDKDLINGKPTGSVRVSFGPYSRQQDADKLLQMLTTCFVSGSPILKKPVDCVESTRHLIEDFKGVQISVNKTNEQRKATSEMARVDKDTNTYHFSHLAITNNHQSLKLEEKQTDDFGIGPLVLSRICIYPVKSCGAMDVTSWYLDRRGLLYDRYWMIVTESGVALTQKQEPLLCLVRPVIDVARRVLTLSFPDHESCEVPVDMEEDVATTKRICQSKVCRDNIQAIDCGPEAATWLSLVLHRPGVRLLRMSDTDLRILAQKDKDESTFLSLANQAQFLLVNENSVAWLNGKIPDNPDCSKENMIDRFRSNFVMRGNCPAFDELKWRELTIGSVKFKVDGPCGRCQMICIDQSSGRRTKEPLTTLAASCRGKMKFGVYLSQRSPITHTKLTVGDNIIPFFS